MRYWSIVFHGWANQLWSSENFSFPSITCISSQLKSQLALCVACMWVLGLQGVVCLLCLEIWSNSLNINNSHSIQMVQVYADLFCLISVPGHAAPHRRWPGTEPFQQHQRSCSKGSRNLDLLLVKSTNWPRRQHYAGQPENQVYRWSATTCSGDYCLPELTGVKPHLSLDASWKEWGLYLCLHL